jgi:hypothetical protein
MYPNNIKWKIYRFIFNLDNYIRPWKVIVLFFRNNCCCQFDQIIIIIIYELKNINFT